MWAVGARFVDLLPEAPSTQCYVIQELNKINCALVSDNQEVKNILFSGQWIIEAN